MKTFTKILSVLISFAFLLVSLPSIHSLAANDDETTTLISDENSDIVYFNKAELKPGIGEKYKLTLFSKNNVTYSDINYYSDNSNIAAISANGTVTAKSVGTVKVFAETEEGYIAQCTVIVKKKPKSIELNASKLTLGVKESFDLDSYVNSGSGAVVRKYTSSNTSVAKVNGNGIVTAVKTGTVNIKVSCYNGVYTTCAVTVKKAPSSVSLSKTSVTMYMNTKITLKAGIPSGSASKITYSSSNESAATVSSSGVVTPRKKGLTTITAETYNGKVAVCNLKVKVVNYNKAYTSSQVRKDISYLKEKYPNVISVSSIGTTAKGNSIPLVKLGKGSKKALIIGGLHSREHMTVSFTMRCIEDYAAIYSNTTTIYGSYDMKELLDNYTLYIVPMANPDGLDIVNNAQKALYDNSKKSYLYKRNANGVNLNRNFPFLWSKITNGTKISSEDYKGKSAGSEPETKALMNICKNNDFRWMFSMHLQGNNVYWRDSYNGTVSSDEALVNKLNKVCGYIKSSKSTDVNGYGGGFENWFRCEFGKPGFCVELVPVKYGYTYKMSENSDFEKLTVWSKTRYTFVQGML